MLKKVIVMNPEIALKTLLNGNLRFIENKCIHPNRTQEIKMSLLNKQRPFAAILSCSDSRVPIELIFDVGIGDLFVVRTAGHVLSPEVIGSIEYAVKSLEVSLVMVLGHENCGAVKAAIECFKSNSLQTLSPNLSKIMEHFFPVLENLSFDNECNYLYDAITKNVKYQVKSLISNDEFIANKIKKREVILLGAIYNLKTCQVEILCNGYNYIA